MDVKHIWIKLVNMAENSGSLEGSHLGRYKLHWHSKDMHDSEN